MGGSRWPELHRMQKNRTWYLRNLVCKHLKSNAIALIKDKQLIGKGCGQTSRIDSLRQAIEKAKQFSFNLQGCCTCFRCFFSV